jgi:RecB family endonuclease NucS
MVVDGFEMLSLSSLTSVVKRLNSTIGEKMILIAGRSTAIFDGRIKSTLEEGDRFLLIKKDFSIILHGPLGVKPLNWQKPQAGPIEFRVKDDKLEMFTQRTKTKEILTITFISLDLVALWYASDESELEIYGDESDFVRYLVSNPDLIEPDFQVLKTEYSTDVGPVDIRGISEDSEVIIEVKKRKATPKDAHQLKRYIEYFKEREKKNVRGILIAPSFPDKVLKYLKEHNLEIRKISWKEIFPLIKRPEKPKLEDFFTEK